MPVESVQNVLLRTWNFSSKYSKLQNDWLVAVSLMKAEKFKFFTTS